MRKVQLSRYVLYKHLVSSLGNLTEVKYIKKQENSLRGTLSAETQKKGETRKITSTVKSCRKT